MTVFNEKRYSIDPGEGKKMDGCPYSAYEDGQDVKDYIIPPKGYKFVGFRFDPDASNQIYDGKLTAEYAKEPFKERLKDNLWKFILAFVIIVVVAVISILVASVFRDPKPKPARPSKEPATVVKKEKEKEKKDKAEKTAEVAPVETKTEEVPATVQTQPAAEPEKIKEPKEEVVEQPAVNVNDPNVKFKQEFWALIHQRTIMMDSYHDLFVTYKGKVEGEEFDYLRFTILKDYTSFKEWYGKLHKMSISDLETINTISDLQNELDKIQ